MLEYHKIDTLFQRDINGTKKLIDGLYRDPTVEYLKDNEWIWTEKIDGTNVRVMWDGHAVTFGGRTEKAQMPIPLLNKLNEYFGGETNAQLFEQTFGDRSVVLYGEGYGAGIQKGGAYVEGGKGVDFILFDLWISGNYQPRDKVEECAKTFGVQVVPVVGKGTLDEAVTFVKSHPFSQIGPCLAEMEGIVCRPSVELNNRTHNRVIVKIKWCDFKD